MAQEEKELLLKDLCARLPYNIAIDCRDEDSRFTCYLTTDILREIQNNTCYREYKPYLFPLSSITEEQNKELNDKLIELELKALRGEIVPSEVAEFEIDFFNKHHIDFRGLIEQGLAIDAIDKNIY